MNRRIRFPSSPSLALAAAALVLSAACSSTDPYAVNRGALQAAWSSLEAGDTDQAARKAERVFVGRAQEGSTYALQRFYAAFLLARAHAREALSSTSGAGRRTEGERGRDDVSSWVAAGYYVAYARDLSARLKGGKPAPKQLPAALAEIDVDRARLELDLLRLTILARFDFAHSAEEELAGLAGELGGADAETFQGAMDSVQLLDPLRPWVLYALFRHHSSREPIEAYRAGALARVCADRHPGSFPEARVQEIVAWTENGSQYVFHCPQCQTGERIDAASLFCPVHPAVGIYEFVADTNISWPRAASESQP